MITIQLITFTSVLQKKSSIYSMHETLLSELETYYNLELIDYKDLSSLKKECFKIIFIATGGVEKFFIQTLNSLPQPFILLTDGMQNSLAASLEIAYWLQTKGLKSEILHGETKSIVSRLNHHYTNFEAQKEIKGKRIGVLGTPATWLIASGVDYLLSKRRWEVDYIDIPLERVTDLFDKITDNQVGEQATNIAGKALACREASPEDLIKALRLYKAIKLICEEEKLDAITLSCFKLIDQIGTTGCLALALLNDEGILAGCEGDLQAIFTLLSIKAVTGKTGFMANPSQINSKTNEIVLAHCTIGTSLTEKYIIRSHFESNSGVAIQGILPTGYVTVVKCGGECLDEYFVSSGTLVENTNFLNVCRTQVRIKLDNPTNYFLRNPLGNHHIIIWGNHEEALNSFFSSNGCRRVE